MKFREVLNSFARKDEAKICKVRQFNVPRENIIPNYFGDFEEDINALLIQNVNEQNNENHKDHLELISKCMLSFSNVHNILQYTINLIKDNGRAKQRLWLFVDILRGLNKYQSKLTKLTKENIRSGIVIMKSRGLYFGGKKGFLKNSEYIFSTNLAFSVETKLLLEGCDKDVSIMTISLESSSKNRIIDISLNETKDNFKISCSEESNTSITRKQLIISKSFSRSFRIKLLIGIDTNIADIFCWNGNNRYDFKFVLCQDVKHGDRINSIRMLNDYSGILKYLLIKELDQSTFSNDQILVSIRNARVISKCASVDAQNHNLIKDLRAFHIKQFSAHFQKYEVKAWFTYSLLKIYGGIPFIEKNLNITAEALVQIIHLYTSLSPDSEQLADLLYHSAKKVIFGIYKSDQDNRIDMINQMSMCFRNYETKSSLRKIEFLCSFLVLTLEFEPKKLNQLSMHFKRGLWSRYWGETDIWLLIFLRELTKIIVSCRIEVKRVVRALRILKVIPYQEDNLLTQVGELYKGLSFAKDRNAVLNFVILYTIYFIHEHSALSSKIVHNTQNAEILKSLMLDGARVQTDGFQDYEIFFQIIKLQIFNKFHRFSGDICEDNDFAWFASSYLYRDGRLLLEQYYFYQRIPFLRITHSLDSLKDLKLTSKQCKELYKSLRGLLVDSKETTLKSINGIEIFLSVSLNCLNYSRYKISRDIGFIFESRELVSCLVCSRGWHMFIIRLMDTNPQSYQTQTNEKILGYLKAILDFTLSNDEYFSHAVLFYFLLKQNVPQLVYEFVCLKSIQSLSIRHISVWALKAILSLLIKECYLSSPKYKKCLLMIFQGLKDAVPHDSISSESKDEESMHYVFLANKKYILQEYYDYEVKYSQSIEKILHSMYRNSNSRWRLSHSKKRLSHCPHVEYVKNSYKNERKDYINYYERSAHSHLMRFQDLNGCRRVLSNLPHITYPTFTKCEQAISVFYQVKISQMHIHTNGRLEVLMHTLIFCDEGGQTVFSGRVSDISEIVGFKNNHASVSIEIICSGENPQQIMLTFTSCKERKRFLNSIQECKNIQTEKTTESKRMINLQNRWIQRNISNFEYLIEINKLAGRTFNKLSQYPIFPLLWLRSLIESDSNIPNERDLTLPVGALNEGRLKEFEARRTSEELEYLYGTHYSNEAIVLYFLGNIEPFTQLNHELNDKPSTSRERDFKSICQLLQSSLNSTSDVKELTPEFFFFPEAFERVDLPKCCANQYDFISKMRLLLESDKVSEQIGDWIDLIFGVAQSGELAIKRKNIFHPRSYDTCSSKENPVVLLHAENIGQVPSQIFLKKHPNRAPCPLLRNELKMIDCLKAYDAGVLFPRKLVLLKPVQIETTMVTNFQSKRKSNRNILDAFIFDIHQNFLLVVFDDFTCSLVNCGEKGVKVKFFAQIICKDLVDFQIQELYWSYQSKMLYLYDEIHLRIISADLSVVKSSDSNLEIQSKYYKLPIFQHESVTRLEYVECYNVIFVATSCGRILQVGFQNDVDNPKLKCIALKKLFHTSLSDISIMRTCRAYGIIAIMGSNSDLSIIEVSSGRELKRAHMHLACYDIQSMESINALVLLTKSNRAITVSLKNLKIINDVYLSTLYQVEWKLYKHSWREFFYSNVQSVLLISTPQGEETEIHTGINDFELLGGVPKILTVGDAVVLISRNCLTLL